MRHPITRFRAIVASAIWPLTATASAVVVLLCGVAGAEELLGPDGAAEAGIDLGARLTR